MTSRRVFTEEFKREAVLLAKQSGNLSATALLDWTAGSIWPSSSTCSPDGSWTGSWEVPWSGLWFFLRWGWLFQPVPPKPDYSVTATEAASMPAAITSSASRRQALFAV